MSASKMLDRLRAKQAEKQAAREYSETPPIPPADGLARRDDVQALDLLDQATKNGHGGDRKSISFNNVKTDIETSPPVGNSEAAALRRLRKDAPPADGLQRRNGFIMPTRETLPAYAAHFEARSVKIPHRPDRQTERIRRLAATVTAAELLAAHRKIKPTLRKDLSPIELHELALTLADAQKREKSLTSDEYRPAREFHPRDVYQPEKQAKGDC